MPTLTPPPLTTTPSTASPSTATPTSATPTTAAPTTATPPPTTTPSTATLPSVKPTAATPTATPSTSTLPSVKPTATTPTTAAPARRGTPPTTTATSAIHFPEPHWIRGLAESLKDRGITPRMLALAGGGLGLVTAAFLPIGVLAASGVGTAALLLAAVFLQVRFVCGLVEKIVIRERGTRARTTEVLSNLLDRGADVAVFVAAGYSIGGGWIGPLLGWLAAVLCLATSYVGLLSSAPVLLEAATYPMNQRHRMLVMTAACVIAAILPAGLRPFAMYLAMVVVVLGCGFALWLRVPRLVKDPV